jgi:hypothetical protein
MSPANASPVAPSRLPRVVAAASHAAKSLRRAVHGTTRVKVTCSQRAKKPTLWQAVNNMVTKGTFCDAATGAAAKKNFAQMTIHHEVSPRISAPPILRIVSTRCFRPA